MEFKTGFIVPVIIFDDNDKEKMSKIGLKSFFEENDFNISEYEFYNGESYFVLNTGEICCYECMERNLIDFIDFIDCLTFLIEDIDQTVFCDSCGKKIESQYGEN